MATKNNMKEEVMKTVEAAQPDLAAENEALKAELEQLKAAQMQPNEPAQPEQKMVKVRLPKTKEKKEDVFVGVNLRTYQIQRGVEVEVPDFVAEVLMHQQEMLEVIMLFEEQNASK